MQNKRPDEIHDQILAYLGINPLDLVEEMREVGLRRAEAKATADTLEYRRKILLSTLKEDRRKDSNERFTDKGLEDYAHAHPDYLAFVRGMFAAIKLHASVEAEYWALRNKFDYLMVATNFAKSEAYALRRDL